MPSEIRLQKFLAGCGIGSRRRCEKIIASGSVTVNGRQVKEPGSKVSDEDTIEVDGVPVRSLKKRYFLLDKTEGTICADRDPGGRRYVLELIPRGREMGLFPVGRLDMDTTGLIVLTNDGELANRIAHPRYRVEKEYRALVKGIHSIDGLKEILTSGVVLENGSVVSGIKVISACVEGDRTRVIIRIHEGRKHVVKRIFLTIGSRVYELERLAIGNIRLDDLEGSRFLEVDEEWVMERIN